MTGGRPRRHSPTDTVRGRERWKSDGQDPRLPCCWTAPWPAWPCVLVYHPPAAERGWRRGFRLRPRETPYAPGGADATLEQGRGSESQSRRRTRRSTMRRRTSGLRSRQKSDAAPGPASTVRTAESTPGTQSSRTSYESRDFPESMWNANQETERGKSFRSRTRTSAGGWSTSVDVPR